MLLRASADVRLFSAFGNFVPAHHQVRCEYEAFVSENLRYTTPRRYSSALPSIPSGELPPQEHQRESLLG